MAIATDDIHRFSVDEYLAIVGSGDPRWEHTEPEDASYNTVTRVEIGDDLTATVRQLLG